LLLVLCHTLTNEDDDQNNKSKGSPPVISFEL
jgi:hypothetical protein